MLGVPSQILDFVQQREFARQNQNFVLADQLRSQIEAGGFILEDTPAGPRLKPHNIAPSKPYLAIFGSGEISPSGRLVHEAILKSIHKSSVNVAIITTPAGFQPNVAVVYQEIAIFFQNHLTNFHPQVKIVNAHNLCKANDSKICEPVLSADYIFTGPGSPSYALSHLRGSLLLNLILNRVQADNVSLGLASAAAIAFSAFSLPVYEIYKVGTPLHWLPGLDFFSKIYQPLTIIPHFNNFEGGIKTDTSRCFMGVKRFSQLLKLLPPDEKIWGLDEQTGVVVDLQHPTIRTYGTGQYYEFSPRNLPNSI